MRKIISLILLTSILLLSVMTFSSCAIVDKLLGSIGETDSESSEVDVPELSGEYLRVSGSPTPTLSFSGEHVEVKLGKRSMKGSYEIRVTRDGGYEIKFDFGNSTTLIGGIGSGVYPISIGVHKGIDYLMLFGTRFDKQ